MGLDPVTHRPRLDDHLNLLSNLQQLLAATNIVSGFTNTWDTRLQSDATQLAKLQLLQNMLQVLGGSTSPTSNLELLSSPLGPSISSQLLESSLHELLGLNNQNQSNKLQNLYNGSTGFFPSQNQPNNFQSFEAPQILQQSLPTDQYPHMNSSCIMKSQKVDHEQLDHATNSSSTTPLNSSLPNLVSASPDQCSTVKQMENNKVINPNECSNPSSTSNTFDMWGDFMYEEVSDAYWKDLIE